MPGLFGDGAANQGQVYEASTWRSVWELPVIYAIENNITHGESVERSASEPISNTRGASHRIPGIQVDGMTCGRWRGRGGRAEEAEALDPVRSRGRA